MRFVPLLLLLSIAFHTAKVHGKTTTYVITKGENVIVDENAELEREDSPEVVEDVGTVENLIETTDGWVQGACQAGGGRKPLIYTENFILEADDKSQVLASVQITVGGNANITCVEVVDRAKAKERPQIIRGGVGYDRVGVSITPAYGKGFDFTVKLYGVF